MGKLILIGDLGASASPARGRTAIYARVASSEQKAGLDQQVARVATWATEHGYSVDEVVTEVGSGLNGHRRKLAGLLRDNGVTTILVEHRDRLGSFGVEHLEAALSAQGRRIVVVVEEGEVEDDLLRDMTEVLTSFCARLYGRRSARQRAERALRCAAEDVPAASQARGRMTS